MLKQSEERKKKMKIQRKNQGKRQKEYPIRKTDNMYGTVRGMKMATANIQSTTDPHDKQCCEWKSNIYKCSRWKVMNCEKWFVHKLGSRLNSILSAGVIKMKKDHELYSNRTRKFMACV